MAQDIEVASFPGSFPLSVHGRKSLVTCSSDRGPPVWLQNKITWLRDSISKGVATKNYLAEDNEKYRTELNHTLTTSTINPKTLCTHNDRSYAFNEGTSSWVQLHCFLLWHAYKIIVGICYGRLAPPTWKHCNTQWRNSCLAGSRSIQTLHTVVSILIQLNTLRTYRVVADLQGWWLHLYVMSQVSFSILQGNTINRAALKVAQYPGFLRLTNLEIHDDRLFAFLIC